MSSLVQYNTFLEEGNYQLDNLGNWKSLVSRLRQFLVQKEQCNGILRKCILGFDKDGVMELLENVSKIRKKVGVNIHQA